jgi:hypothetical protein
MNNTQAVQLMPCCHAVCVWCMIERQRQTKEDHVMTCYCKQAVVSHKYKRPGTAGRESSEHRPAFRAITQNNESFIKFANGIINETNTLIATVMQKLPEIRTAQEKMGNAQEWGRLSEEEQSIVTSRLEDNEREVKHALPLCNKTLQMFGYLNTDKDIRSLFLLGELCPRLVNMLLHVLGKLVGSKGLDLKVRYLIIVCILHYSK